MLVKELKLYLKRLNIFNAVSFLPFYKSSLGYYTQSGFIKGPEIVNKYEIWQHRKKKIEKKLWTKNILNVNFEQKSINTWIFKQVLLQNN